jgi:hypothetical protein
MVAVVPAVSAGWGGLRAEPKAATLAEEVSSAPLPNIGTHWYGAYLGGRNVGHARAWVRTARANEPEVSRVVGLEIVMSVKGGGAVDTLRVLDTRTYANVAPYRLVDAKYRQESSRAVDVRQLLETSDGWIVKRALNGEPQTIVSVTRSRELLSDQIGSWGEFIRKGRRTRKVEGWNFNWESLKDEAYTAQVLKLSTEHVAGVKTTVADLAVDYKSLKLKTKVRLLADGSMLEMNVGAHMVLRLEEQEQAKSGMEALDASTAGVRVKRSLGEPSKISSLSLEVSVSNDYQFVPRGNRRMSGCHGSTCRLEIESKPGAIVRRAEREKALKATLAFDSDSLAIKRRSADVIKGAVGRDRVRRLVNYVYSSLRKQLATNLPSASVVLKEGYGDCTEHTWLFVALARAAGIPSRPVYGLAYVEGPQRRFAYHAWAEVEIDGRWVEVDPTWGQLLADATHLHLGGDAASMAAALGHMEIRVLKVNTRELP